MWTSEDGLGAVFDIQQAADGYLWLTTSTGVFRFDGVRFQSVEEATNGAVPNSEIHAVFLSASGGVWLKTRAAGLLFWKDGRLTTFTDRRCTPVLQMEGIAEDRDGSLWLQASGGLFHMRGSTCEQIGPEHGYPGGFPAAILVDREGTVWVRTLAGALLFLLPGQSTFRRMEYDAGATSAAFVLATATHNTFLHEAPDGAIWLSDDRGLRRVTNPRSAPMQVPREKGKEEHIQFGDFTFGSDSSIWAVSDKGLRRFDHVDQWTRPQATESAPGESFTTRQGLSSDAVWKVLIDREGSIWVGTNSGLDRLRRTAITTLPLPPAQEHDFSILAGDQGSIWTGNRSLPSDPCNGRRSRHQLSQDPWDHLSSTRPRWNSLVGGRGGRPPLSFFRVGLGTQAVSGEGVGAGHFSCCGSQPRSMDLHGYRRGLPFHPAHVEQAE